MPLAASIKWLIGSPRYIASKPTAPLENSYSFREPAVTRSKCKLTMGSFSKERFLPTVQAPLNQHGRCFLCYFQLWHEESPELFLWDIFLKTSTRPSSTLCAGCPRAVKWRTEGGTTARVVARASGTCDLHGVCVTKQSIAWQACLVTSPTTVQTTSW